MKTIVIGLNWLGDIIMSMPAIMAACENSEVHIISRPHLAEIYELFPVPLHVHPVTTNATNFTLIKEMWPLRSIKADVTIVFPDSIRAALLAKVCDSKKSTGFATQWRSFLLDQAVVKPENYQQMHESDLHFMLVKEAGLATRRPSLIKGSFPDEYFRILAEKIGLNFSEPFIILAPGAAFGAAKRWPPEKFSALADLLYDHYKIPLVITASKGERELANAIRSGSRAKVINAAGSTSLKELACLLSRASVMVANDSGTMHLGALYSTPTVVPVGPTDMIRTGPLNPDFAAVSADGCPQAPCRQRICPRSDHLCMQAIAATTVYSEVVRLLTKKND